MRPILKSQSSPDVFIEHGEAKQFLIAELGKYCSYCETPLPIAHLEVEHILYKDKYSLFALDWANFLLSCKNCNATKAQKDLRTISSFLPHLHNLLCYLDLRYAGIVIVKSTLSLLEKQRAKAFIELVGLDKVPVLSNLLDSDDRWEQRIRAYELAKKHKNRYTSPNRTTDIETIIDLAKGYGFFTIWFFVFQEYIEVRAALIESFDGTDKTCFDAANGYEPLPRFLNDAGLLLAQ